MIKNSVYEIRGKRVMLASDIATLFNCKNGTKEINQAYSRNIEKFNNDDTWILTEEEKRTFLVTCGDHKVETRGGKYKNPRVFTKEGLIVLSNIFKSPEIREIVKEIMVFFDDENSGDIIFKSPEIQGESIKSMIYEIRGKQVMLDTDLALLYNCKNGTKSINLAVRRHQNRFPERFCFQINLEEFNSLRFQSETAKLNKMRTLPYAFTEEGVAMLATVIKTEVAEKVSISIMDSFVAMRKYISTNLLEQRYINNQVFKNTEDIKLLKESFEKFEEKRVSNEIYFNGQIYDAYSKIIDIMNSSKKEIIIIDRYADKIVLDMISKLKVKVTLVVKNKPLITDLDIEKYNKQYHNLKIVYDDTYHDRYLIIDKRRVYHLGASLNHVGSRTFSINIISDKEVIDLLINHVSKF